MSSSCRWRVAPRRADAAAAAPLQPPQRPRLLQPPPGEGQGGRGAEAPETADVELVSLEDADAEATGKKAEGDAVEGDDDIEVEETEEAPFIEEQEEGDDDVTDIIGEGREDEEET